MSEKRLTRAADDQMIAGVCAGLARYFNIDPVIVRALFVIVGLAGGASLLVYLVLWLIMPQE
jgi:phage shock protein C